MRIHTEGGFTTKVESKVSGISYVISTAKAADTRWQTAVFEIDDEGKLPLYSPSRVTHSETIEEAETEHSYCEEAVENLPTSEWANMRVEYHQKHPG